MVRTALAYLIAGWSGFFVMAVELARRPAARADLRQQHLRLGRDHHDLHARAVARLSGGRPLFDARAERAAARRDPDDRRADRRAAAAVRRADAGCVVARGARIRASARCSAPSRCSSCRRSSPEWFRRTRCACWSQDRNSSGRHAGQLYFVSTFGSAAGTLLTSFYLVLLLEVNQILLGLLLISVAIGACAWFVRGPAQRDQLMKRRSFAAVRCS